MYLSSLRKPLFLIALLGLSCCTDTTRQTSTEDSLSYAASRQEARRIVDSIQYQTERQSREGVTFDHSFLGTIRQNRIVASAVLNPDGILEVIVVRNEIQGAPRPEVYCRMAQSFNEVVKRVRIVDQDGTLLGSSSC